METASVEIKYMTHVSMEPNYLDNRNKPYFWAVFKDKGGVNTNECSGWEETPQKAWESAYKFYDMYKRGK